MQPDVSEQLDGVCRVLDEVVAPAVGDAFARTQLRAVAETLAQLSAWWPRSGALLAAENRELRALLRELIERLPDVPDAAARESLRARVRGVLRAQLDRQAGA